jgi:hypothetical protein
MHNQAPAATPVRTVAELAARLRAAAAQCARGLLRLVSDRGPEHGPR